MHAMSDISTANQEVRESIARARVLVPVEGGMLMFLGVPSRSSCRASRPLR
jgi:hypothetical protein